MIITQLKEQYKTKNAIYNGKNRKIDQCLTNYLLHNMEEGLRIGKFSLKSLEEILNNTEELLMSFFRQ